MIKPSRGVAQPGSALAWGARGRRFKSFRPDQINALNFIWLSSSRLLTFQIKNILGTLIGTLLKITITIFDCEVDPPRWGDLLINGGRDVT